MPKNYKRITDPIDLEALAYAVQLRKENPEITYDELSYRFGISSTTIRKYMHKPIGKKVCQGRDGTFTEEEEEEIVRFVLERSDRCQPLSRRAFARLVFTTAEAKGTHQRLQCLDPDGFKKNYAGQQFIADFLRKHQELRFKNGVSLSLARYHGFSEPAVNHFFDNLEKVVTDELLTPLQIWNADETGFDLVKKCSDKFLGRRGQETFTLKNKERGQLVTMVGCCSAGGDFVPPMFVFKHGTRDVHVKMERGPHGSIYGYSDKGWITTGLFLDWLKHFKNAIPPNQKHLLIVDNHTSHVSYEAMTFCRENDIIVLTLPPHTSDEMQPLDVGFFSPLKGRYARSLMEWRDHYHEVPREADIPGIVKDAYEKSARSEVARSAFRYSGIWNDALNRPDRETVTSLWLPSGRRRRRVPIRFEPETVPRQIVQQEAADYVLRSVDVPMIAEDELDIIEYDYSYQMDEPTFQELPGTEPPQATMPFYGEDHQNSQHFIPWNSEQYDLPSNGFDPMTSNSTLSRCPEKDPQTAREGEFRELDAATEAQPSQDSMYMQQLSQSYGQSNDAGRMAIQHAEMPVFGHKTATQQYPDYHHSSFVVGAISTGSDVFSSNGAAEYPQHSQLHQHGVSTHNQYASNQYGQYYPGQSLSSGTSVTCPRTQHSQPPLATSNQTESGRFPLPQPLIPNGNPSYRSSFGAQSQPILPIPPSRLSEPQTFRAVLEACAGPPPPPPPPASSRTKASCIATSDNQYSNLELNRQKKLKKSMTAGKKKAATKQKKKQPPKTTLPPKTSARKAERPDMISSRLRSKVSLPPRK